MKTSQWVGALAVLVVMVFFITFAMNFLRPTEVRPTGPGPGPVVTYRPPTFFVKSLPANPLTLQPVDPTDRQMAAYAIYHEERKVGHLDFLMENPYDEDIKIGLINKNCRCASVKVAPATPEWKTRRAVLAAGEIMAAYPAADLGLENFFAVTSAVLRTNPDAELQKLQEALPATATLDPRDSPQAGQQEAVVQSRFVGFIRLGWDDTKMGPQPFSAELWIGNPNSNVTAMLEVPVIHFVPPLRAEFGDVDAGKLNEAELEKKPFEASFRVWSATRAGLKVKAEVVHPVRFDSNRWDPFEVGDPVPLSPQELRDLKRLPDAAGSVLSAYRIPVKLSGRSPDGKVAVDLGGFRRRLRVWSDGDGKIEPIELTVTGTVQGSVQIGNKRDGGRVLLGVFDSASGSPEEIITLSANSSGVGLEVDKDRTSEFLREGTFLEETAPLGDAPCWKLHVQVKPNAAHGDFPRDDAMYRDSGVYLKVKGKVVQNVRVPVLGTANDR
jgi:hypothetical protein